MLRMMNAIFREKNFHGRPSRRRRAKSMAWKASMATTIAMARMYSGWSLYPMKALTGPIKNITSNRKAAATEPTAPSAVQNTLRRSTPSRLE